MTTEMPPSGSVDVSVAVTKVEDRDGLLGDPVVGLEIPLDVWVDWVDWVERVVPPVAEDTVEFVSNTPQRCAFVCLWSE